MRLTKTECMDSMRDEYNRLGRRLDGVDWTPEQITHHVAQLFSTAGQEANAAFPPPSTSAPLPLENGSATDGPYFFTTGVGEDGSWKLETYSCTTGDFVTSVTLPDPVGSYYSVSFSVADGFVLLSPGQLPVPCVDIMIAPDTPAAPATAKSAAEPQQHPPPALPPGVAAFSAKLPGMSGPRPGLARFQKTYAWSNMALGFSCLQLLKCSGITT